MAANQERNFLAEAAGLLAAARGGTLATIMAGIPHAALVTPALDAEGFPLLLLSEIAAHTKHLRANPACALLVTGPPAGANPQTAPRLLLTCAAIPATNPGARESFLKFHPYAKLYIDFTDFHLWRLVVNDAHYIGGFAAAAQLETAALHHEIINILHAGNG